MNNGGNSRDKTPHIAMIQYQLQVSMYVYTKTHNETHTWQGGFTGATGKEALLITPQERIDVKVMRTCLKRNHNYKILFMGTRYTNMEQEIQILMKHTLDLQVQKNANSQHNQEEKRTRRKNSQNESTKGMKKGHTKIIKKNLLRHACTMKYGAVSQRISRGTDLPIFGKIRKIENSAVSGQFPDKNIPTTHGSLGRKFSSYISGFSTPKIHSQDAQHGNSLLETLASFLLPYRHRHHYELTIEAAGA